MMAINMGPQIKNFMCLNIELWLNTASSYYITSCHVISIPGWALPINPNVCLKTNPKQQQQQPAWITRVAKHQSYQHAHKPQIVGTGQVHEYEFMCNLQNFVLYGQTWRKFCYCSCWFWNIILLCKASCDSVANILT